MQRGDSISFYRDGRLIAGTILAIDLDPTCAIWVVDANDPDIDYWVLPAELEAKDFAAPASSKDTSARVKTNSTRDFECDTADKDKATRVAQACAKEFFGVSTLETRHSDQLDFYDCSVWSIKRALETAFRLGAESTKAG